MTANKLILDEEDLKNRNIEVEEQEEQLLSGNVIDLPSQGKLGYPGQVRYRDILVKDEEVLSATTAKTYARTINSILKDITGNVPWFEKMCVHDRDFILVYVWANNYSNIKETEERCTHCGHTDTYTVDFLKQDTTNINEKFKGYYEMTLASGQQITVTLNTVADEIAAEVYKSKNPEARFEHIMICRSISNGYQMTMDERINWVEENILGREMAKIRKFHTTMKFGLNSSIEHTCRSCGGEFVSEFPFRQEDIFAPELSATVDDFL